MPSHIPTSPVSRDILFLCTLVSLFYFSWWLRPGQADNLTLYLLLFIGEIYHVFMAFTFWFTVRKPRQPLVPTPATTDYYPQVDIFIPVCGEPVEIVSKTVSAAVNLNYPNHKVYVLNDGRVAKKDNWLEIGLMAESLGAIHIARTVPGGAKSGNINHTLKQTHGELVVIFDADMVPTPDFLQKTVSYFSDPLVGFVQTPQYYVNHPDNHVTRGSWDQQQFFFGPIMAGKSQDNASFICGTNVVIRRTALEEVGGMEENNIAEDFATSIFIHNNGWKSVYLTDILSHGLAPLDLSSYTQQQFRWARGSLEVLFFENPLFKKGLTWKQKIHYLSSGLYYLNGLIVVIDILMPIVYLITGLQPVSVSTTSFAVYFLPFMFLNLYTLNLASAGNLSLSAFSFSYSSWFLQLLAFISIVIRKKISFAVTPKSSQKINYLPFITPHLAYIFILVASSIFAILREGYTSSVLTNIAWGSFSVVLFIPYILAALTSGETVATIPFGGNKVDANS